MAVRSAGALPQTEAMHDAARVIRVVAHAEAGKNGIGEARRGPPLRIKARGSRAGLIDLGDLSKLVRVQPAGAPRRAALAQTVEATPV